MTTLSAGMLCVQYSKSNDRLSHTIGILIDDSYLPLLESIEGSEEEPWPASPPMQQMVEECFSPGAPPVLLGVGLSGNGHWSIAVETLASKRLKFDVACKNSKNAAWLGSQYRVLVPFKIVSYIARSQAPAWERTDLEALSPASLDSTTPRPAEPTIPSVPKQSLGTSRCNFIVFDLAQHRECQIEMRVSIGQLEFLDSERLLRVLPNSSPSEIRTHRWCYEIGIFEGR